MSVREMRNKWLKLGISVAYKGGRHKDYRRLSVNRKQMSFNHHVSWENRLLCDKHIALGHWTMVYASLLWCVCVCMCCRYSEVCLYWSCFCYSNFSFLQICHSRWFRLVQMSLSYQANELPIHLASWKITFEYDDNIMFVCDAELKTLFVLNESHCVPPILCLRW